MLTPESGYRMGNLTHVVIQFPTVWWDDAIPKWLASNPGSNVSSEGGGPDGAGPAGAGEFSLWHNLNHAGFLPGSHTLLTFLGDPQSSVYEGMPDAAVQAALVARLKAQHPKLTIPEPSAFFISRHGYDRNSYGAYSIALVGWNGNDHGTLQAPLRACETDTVRVRLAGEAMCDDLNGCKKASTAQGAALPWFGLIALDRVGGCFPCCFGLVFVFRLRQAPEMPLQSLGLKFARPCSCPAPHSIDHCASIADTHGALQSGREAAAHYLHHYDGAPKPSEVPGLLLCDL
jgi:hypothetical protein